MARKIIIKKWDGGERYWDNTAAGTLSLRQDFNSLSQQLTDQLKQANIIIGDLSVSNHGTAVLVDVATHDGRQKGSMTLAPGSTDGALKLVTSSGLLEKVSLTQDLVKPVRGLSGIIDRNDCRTLVYAKS